MQPLSSENDYLIKSLRFDALCFFDDFINGMTHTDDKKTEPRTKMRNGKHKSHTVFATGAYSYDEKPSPYPIDQLAKIKFLSRHQSTTLITKEAQSPVFGHNRNRQNALVGVILDPSDALINRLYRDDFGTINRPYEFDSAEEAKKYYLEKNNKQLFGDYEVFKKAIADKMGKQRYNEVLARIRWNPETSAVGIFSDTDESRYVAQIYAEQIKKTLQQKTGKLPESLPENYDPPIYYYLPGNSKNFKLYSKEEQRRDREKANLLLKDKKQREMAFEIGNFACLLLAGDPNEVLSMQYNGKPIIIELIRLRLFHIADSMVKCVGKNNIVDYLKEHDLLKMAANQFLNNDQCLIEAINMNRPDIVKHIITLAPHLINQVDSTENELTPLLLAATLGYKDITNLLLTHGAQIEKKDKVGDTVLKSAAFLGHEDVVELLLQKGAKLEDKNNVGTTALMYAASSGETNVIELLLKKGAKLEEKDNIGHTALMYASVGKKKDAIQLLLTKGAKLEEKNKVGCTALMCSVLAGQIEFIELLLEKGAKLEEKDNTGHTALMHAVERGQIDIIELLLKKGAKLEEKNKVGHTALMCAAVNGKLDVVTLLLKRGAKIEAHDNNNKTVLTCAAEKGQKEVVELLLANGANVNARAIFGYTVLMHAVLKGRKEVVDLLLTKGADVYAENNAGNTALTLAVKNNQKEVVAVLQQHLLTKYLAKTKQRESTHHLNSWSIFGKTINFGYSAGAKVAAAEALYAVLNQGADQTSLRDHLAVLANGELGKIYKACCDVGLIDKKIVSPGLHFFK